MSVLGLCSALGAAYDIKKSENLTDASRLSDEEIWKAMHGNPSDEDIQLRMNRLGFTDRSQLYQMVDTAAKNSFLNTLNVELDQQYSEYSASLTKKSNGGLEQILSKPLEEAEPSKTKDTAMIYNELVGKLGQEVYTTGLEAETKYSFDSYDNGLGTTYTSDESDLVHKWFVGAANTMVIDAVYDKLFNS